MTIPMPGSPECECATCEGCAEERHEGLMREGEPCPACHVHADPSYREEKRLTDAECAAEYWRAGENLRYALAMDQARYRVRPERSDDPPSVSVNKAWREKNTWRRFAHTHHALEES